MAHWTQRRCSPRCRCTAGVWCGPLTSSRRCPRRSPPPARGRSRSVVAAQGHSADQTSVSTVAVEPQRHPVGRSRARSRTRCGAPTGRSRSSPVSRSPATTHVSNSNNCARCCAPGSPRCPTPRTSQARRALARRRRSGVTGVMGHPGVAGAIADSALCLLVGTRMSVTSRAGLDDVLASVAGGVDRIGGAIRRMRARAYRRPARLAVAVDRGPDAERQADAACGCPTWCPTPSCGRRGSDGPGIRYRDAMTVLDAALPDGTDVVVDAGNIGASAIHYLPVRRDGTVHRRPRHGRDGIQFWSRRRRGIRASERPRQRRSA